MSPKCVAVVETRGVGWRQTIGCLGGRDHQLRKQPIACAQTQAIVFFGKTWSAPDGQQIACLAVIGLPVGARTQSWRKTGLPPGRAAMGQRVPDRSAGSAPGGTDGLRLGCATSAAGEHRNERGQLLGCRLTADHAQQGGCRGRPLAGLGAHSGMFPCFLGGRDSRLLRSCRRARMTWMRVSEGAITASTNPRSAAM